MAQASEAQFQQAGSRFGIAQMMIVVAILAVVLACAFPGAHIPGRPKPGFNAGNLMFGLSELIVGSFSLLGAAVVVSNWIRERRLPEEPGCLLFLFCAFAFLMANAAEGLYAVIVSRAQSGDQSLMSYGIGLLYVRGITQFFLAFVCLFGFPRKRWWWQIGFLCLLFSMLTQLGMTVVSFTMLGANANNALAFGYVRLAVGVVSTMVVLGLLLCSVIDLAKKEKRSRLHWLGVLCFFVFSILPVATRLIASQYLSFSEMYGAG